MIQINDVVKSFDGFRALDGLTMKVEEGSIYGLVDMAMVGFYQRL